METIITQADYDRIKNMPLIPGTEAWEIHINTPRCYGCAHSLGACYGSEQCEIDGKFRDSMKPQFNCKHHKRR